MLAPEGGKITPMWLLMSTLPTPTLFILPGPHKLLGQLLRAMWLSKNSAGHRINKIQYTSPHFGIFPVPNKLVVAAIRHPHHWAKQLASPAMEKLPDASGRKDPAWAKGNTVLFAKRRRIAARGCSHCFLLPETNPSIYWYTIYHIYLYIIKIDQSVYLLILQSMHILHVDWCVPTCLLKGSSGRFHESNPAFRPLLEPKLGPICHTQN